MIDFSPLARRWQTGELARWGDRLLADVKRQLRPGRHGDLPRWLAAVEQLPNAKPSSVELDADCIRVGCAADCGPGQQAQVDACLRRLHPWRKGPYAVFDVHIDTEWRSDWKWRRVAPALDALAGRRVLDVGCGSGYHCWRMLGAGASEVIGIDPTPLFVLQFQALKRYVARDEAWVLPLGIEQVPADLQAFDSVFSMGVLYHRRSPIEHLAALRGALREGGQLVLETLVVEGGATTCLIPSGRYARMGNVWFLPSADMLILWLKKLGFRKPELIDVTRTTSEEQRTTDWMTFHSLADFLDPEDSDRTVEGYPAPRRAIVTALR